MTLLDYIYADMPRLAALQGQLTGKAAASHAAVDLAGFEMELAAQGQLLDLSRDNPGRSLRDAGLRAGLGQKLCVKVKGRAVLEDYSRLRRLLAAHAQTAAFANQLAQDQLRHSDDFKQLEMTVAAIAEQLKEETDRNARTESQNRLRQMKADIDEALSASIVARELDNSRLAGLQTWLETFLADTALLRLYPRATALDEQVLGYLPAGSLTTDAPFDMITVLGVVTSVPDDSSIGFDPLAEFDQPPGSSAQSLEAGLRQDLAAVSALDHLSRGCHFPRVMVRPLLVYRSFGAA